MQETCDKQAIIPGQLNIHADRGPSMTSKCVAQFMADMGVTKTHSRPYVSNDNPYSEAQFKTLKYCPSFPERFGSIQDARGFCQDFLYLVQHRASTFRYRIDDTGARSLWLGQANHGIPARSAPRGFRGKPKALQVHTATTAKFARGLCGSTNQTPKMRKLN